MWRKEPLLTPSSSNLEDMTLITLGSGWFGKGRKGPLQDQQKKRSNLERGRPDDNEGSNLNRDRSLTIE